jgi:hypothetical protein
MARTADAIASRSICGFERGTHPAAALRFDSPMSFTFLIGFTEGGRLFTRRGICYDGLSGNPPIEQRAACRPPLLYAILSAAICS